MKDILQSSQIADDLCQSTSASAHPHRRARIKAKVRLYLQRIWVALLLVSGGLWWARCQLRKKGAVVVMTFHRVLADSEFGGNHRVPGIVVREETFRRLAEHVSRRYEVVKLNETAAGTPNKELRMAFTFDDGWSDNYSVALPVARELGIPLTIFICPGLTGCNAPFWPERVINLLVGLKPSINRVEIETVIDSLKHCGNDERARIIEELSNKNGAQGEPFVGESALSWVEIEEMAKLGVRFGSHTYTHQILTEVELNAVRREVCESKSAIECALSKECDLFAYPNGDWSPETRQVLAESGFRLAFTTERGAWTGTSDPLAIPRANVYEGNLVGLRGKFCPSMFEYTTCWKVWRAMKQAESRVVENKLAASAVPSGSGERAL